MVQSVSRFLFKITIKWYFKMHKEKDYGTKLEIRYRKCVKETRA